MKIVGGLLALTLLASACGSVGDDVSAAADEASAEASTTSAAPTTEPMSDSAESDAPYPAAGKPDVTNDDQGASSGESDPDEPGAEIDPAESSANNLDTGLDALLNEFGIDASPELITCIEDRGADPSASTIGPGGLELVLAVLSCTPAEAAAYAASPPPPGISDDASTCALEELFRYLGELPVEEGVAALKFPDIPQDIRAEYSPIAVNKCGLTAEQVDLLMDS